MSFDSKCYELAEYFFGSKDPRLQEIAQEIQDAVESFPSEWDGETALRRLGHLRPYKDTACECGSAHPLMHKQGCPLGRPS